MTLFPPRQAPFINYDWTDVDNATGYVLYDGWGATTSVSTLYYLTPSNEADELIGSVSDGTLLETDSGTVSDVAFVKRLDLDFDTTTFQLPRTIKGQAVVHVCLFFNEVAAVTAAEEYVIVKLRKVSGGESEIASVQSQTITGITTNLERSFTLPITVPQTHFKKGDQIRITVEGWAKNTGGSYSLIIAHNPSDRAGNLTTAGNTRMVAAIPFRMNQ